MSEPKHSPLPWKTWVDHQTIISADQKRVAEILQRANKPEDDLEDETVEANAKLVIRAVNSHYALLAACKALDEAWKDPFKHGPDGDYNGINVAEPHRTIWRQMRAAIKLAEAR